MSRIRHHTIAITSAFAEPILAVCAFCEAREITYGKMDSPINAFTTVFVAPDGSKENRLESDTGDLARDALKAFIKSLNKAKGFQALDWVEVEYGGDFGAPRIADHQTYRRGK